MKEDKLPQQILITTAIIAKYLGFQCFITCYRNSPFFVNMNLIIKAFICTWHGTTVTLEANNSAQINFNHVFLDFIL